MEHEKEFARIREIIRKQIMRLLYFIVQNKEGSGGIS